jgi:biotin carboxyl carrier protein
MDPLALYTVSRRGRTREVKVLSIAEDSTAIVQLDGDTFEVAFPEDLALNDPTSIRVGSRRYRLMVTKNSGAMAFRVKVDGKPFVLELKTEAKELSPRGRRAAVPAPTPQRERVVTPQKGAIVAMMPGKVVLVKVKPGDRVTPGDPLCVLEAMKMENEVVAPKRGTITEVKVEAGAPVAKGDVLVIIE